MESLAGALFALFLLAGRFSLVRGTYEPAPELIQYELRVWAALGLVCVAVMYSPKRFRMARQGFPISAPLAQALVLLLPLYVAASYIWSPDYGAATTKLIDVAMLSVVCLCMTPFVNAGRATVVRHWFWVWIVIATGAMCLIACASIDSTRASVLGGGPNVFGRNMALLFLGSLYFQRRSSSLKAWRWYPVMALALMMVVLSGSRGALLAVSVGVFIYLLIDSRFRRRNVLAAGCLVLAAQVVLFTTEMGARAYEMFEYRILDQTFDQQYTSGRDDLFALAYELGLERPLFGHGLSGFTITLSRNYPHNIVLELFCETGIVGVSLLTVLVISAFVFVFRHRHYCDPTIWGAFGLTLSAAMFSGDFFDSRGIFIVAMLGSQEFVAVRVKKNSPLRAQIAHPLGQFALQQPDRPAAS